MITFEISCVHRNMLDTFSSVYFFPFFHLYSMSATLDCPSMFVLHVCVPRVGMMNGVSECGARVCVTFFTGRQSHIDQITVMWMESSDGFRV